MAYLMIVDDDEDFTTAAASSLRQAGHHVEVVPETNLALRKMQARRPDLVVLDVMFPEDAGAGFELARTMRQMGGPLKTVPIVMLTAINNKFPLGFSVRDIDDDWLPVSDFLEKPVDLAALSSRVQALLAKTARPGEPAPEG